LKGVPRPLADMLARLPLKTPLQRESRVATALSTGALALQKRRDFDEMALSADRVVAVCQWLYEALRLNGVPEAKLVLNRQGLARDFAPAAPASGVTHAPLRLLYLGRWHPFKGVDVAVRAVRSLPRDVSIRLALQGVAAGDEEHAYRDEVERLAAGDPRIQVLPPLAPHEVSSALKDFDVLVVPSVCLETGPLVVLEAKAAGLFVIGSRLGGIAELVREPNEGMLVPSGDVAAWGRAIAAVAKRPRPLAQPQSVRTMDDVAADMAELYRAFVAAEPDYALRP
jgi:glycosyltransferase involved in cell wall biosynthesis